MPIPKVIYQTWITKNLPPSVKSVRERIQNLNPDYKMVLYDDQDMEEFIRNNFDEHIYKSYKRLYVGAARADFWRYCMLYKTGGVYLDIDSDICRPLDELIEPGDQCIITREGNAGIFNNWIMIFEKEHPILKLVIEKCCYNIANPISNFICDITGPQGPFTQAVNEIMSPFYGKDVNLYFETDADLNSVLNCPQNTTRGRFHGVDMEDFANWKHEHAEVIYQYQRHWRAEPKIFND